jgi:hypothetical protein
VQIEEKRMLWEQEQKIMFCDILKLDDAQRTYVLAMRSHIAKEKARLLSSSEGLSAGMGMEMEKVVSNWCPEMMSRLYVCV